MKAALLDPMPLSCDDDVRRRNFALKSAPPRPVSIQVSGFDAAVSDGWLRFGGKREAAVVAECGFRDDSGL
jgi:hypothetical protein